MLCRSPAVHLLFFWISGVRIVLRRRDGRRAHPEVRRPSQHVRPARPPCQVSLWTFVPKTLKRTHVLSRKTLGMSKWSPYVCVMVCCAFWFYFVVSRELHNRLDNVQLVYALIVVMSPSKMLLSSLLVSKVRLFRQRPLSNFFESLQAEKLKLAC